MKLLLLPVLMAFIAGVQVWCEEMDPKEESDYWTRTNQIQDGWISNNPFREILLRMTRKPRPHQFIGLMGKRSMANAQITHKRMTVSHSSLGRRRVLGSMPQGHLRGHRINSFVGLMGKRSQEEPDSYEWSTIRSYDKRR